jgi:hypothetical protein
MAITLGKDGTGIPTPTGGNAIEGVISATYTEECETIDISNRSNVGGTSGTPGRKASKAGFTTKTWEIECHDPDGLLASLNAAGTSGSYSVMSVSEAVSIDGAVVYSVTLKEF